MRSNYLKFGFLSTYKSTVFVRRTDMYLFEVSLPISEQATNPSLRQCFVAFSVFAANDPKFIEPEGISSAQLKIPSHQFAQTSRRPSPLRNQVDTKVGVAGENINSKSILFGGDDHVARHWVNCKKTIQESMEKAIFEVTWDGKPAIAKCWSLSRYERFKANYPKQSIY